MWNMWLCAHGKALSKHIVACAKMQQDERACQSIPHELFLLCCSAFLKRLSSPLLVMSETDLPYDFPGELHITQSKLLLDVN